MKKEEKEKFVKWMKEELEKVPAVVAADFRGLSVAKMTELRGRCREAGVQFKVVKNTLTRRAAEGTPLSALSPLLDGPTALAWHGEDPGAAARVLTDFAREKENEALKVKGGALGRRVFSPEEVKNVMATLPGRPALLSRLAGLLGGGPQKLHGVIAAGPAMLYRVLSALKEQRAAG